MSLKQISLVWGTLRNQKSSQVILDETNEDISNKQTNKQTVNANTPSRNTDRPKNVKGVQCLTFITPRQAQKNRILTIYGEFLWAVLLWLLEVCPFICIDKLLKMHDSHKTSTGWKATKRSQCVLKVFDILSVATSQFSLKVRYIYIYIFCFALRMSIDGSIYIGHKCQFMCSVHVESSNFGTLSPGPRIWHPKMYRKQR